MKSTMNVSLNATANYFTDNSSTTTQCPIAIPLASWDPSFLNAPAKMSTILAISVNVVTMPLTIVFNALIIFVVWKNPSLHIERVIVLAYLASTDIIVGLISQPLFIAREALVLQLKTKAMNCDININTCYFFFGFLLVSAAFYQLVVVTYERYVAIIHPFKYPTRITVARITYATIGLWALNTPLSVLYFVLLAFNIPVWYIDIFYTIVAIVLTIFMVYWYIQMFVAVRRQKQQIHVPQPGQNTGSNNPHTSQNRKGIMTAILLFGCFVVSFLPQIILFIFKQVLGVQGSVFLLLQPWVLTCVNLSSFVNPIIYGLRTKELRLKCLKSLGFKSNEIVP